MDFLSRRSPQAATGPPSEVVRAGLRILEDQETRLAALRGALVEGEDSGAPEPFDLDALVAAKKA